MASENTPLAPSTTTDSSPLTPNVVIGSAGKMISSVMTKENATAAATYVQDKAKMLQKMATDGNLSIRLMAFIGGTTMVVTNFLSLFGRFFTLRFVSLILCIYTLFFGLLICALEGRSFGVPTSLSERVRKYALFLNYVWGRGGFYVFAGSLQFSQLNLVDMVVGAYMCFVGVTYIIIGNSTAKKLSEIRKNMVSEEVVKEKFKEADVDNNGLLTEAGFKILTESVGMTLSVHELHTAFSVVDLNHDDRITYEEFIAWWTQWSVDSPRSAQFDV